MPSYDVGAVVAMWKDRLGDLRGDLLRRAESLAPFSSEEISAAESSQFVSWAYTIKVVENERERIQAKRTAKVRLRDGEVVTVLEKEFRNLWWAAPHDAKVKILDEHMLTRKDIAILSDSQKEDLLTPLRDAVDAEEERQKSLDRMSRERVARNLARLRELTTRRE